MSRPKGSKNRPKFQQMTFDGLTGTDNTLPVVASQYIEDEVINKMTEIHHMVRAISRSGADNPSGARSLQTLEAEIKAWFDKGYKLFATHYLGTDPEFYQMMYILVKEV